MAAALAAWIKGQDVIADAEQLRLFAIDQLDISSFAFDGVIEQLAELDMIRKIERSGGHVRSFFESVPETHERMYDRLGTAWLDRGPTEIEAGLLQTVDLLSYGPMRVSDLDLDPDAKSHVLELGSEAAAVRTIEADEGNIAFSPFFTFEQPEAVRDAVLEVGVDEIRAAVTLLREYQGTPLSSPTHGPILRRLAAAGLVAAPGLARPDGSHEAFAIAPYGLAADLRMQRPVLDKALAVLAAVRMGEHFGGVTKLRLPVLILERLLEPGRVVARHSDTPRQYGVLQKLGIVEIERTSYRPGISLIEDRDGDNALAVRLAIDLLEFGEAADTKEVHPGHEQSLAVAGNYVRPIATTRSARVKTPYQQAEIRDIIETMMGRRISG